MTLFDTIQPEVRPYFRIIVPRVGILPAFSPLRSDRPFSFDLAEQLRLMLEFGLDGDTASAAYNGRGRVYPFGDWFCPKDPDDAPHFPGTYIFCAAGEIVYVGESTDLNNRFDVHGLEFDGHPNGKLWWRCGKMRVGVACWLALSEGSHISLEQEMIRKFTPPMNVRGIEGRHGRGLSIYPRPADREGGVA